MMYRFAQEVVLIVERSRVPAAALGCMRAAE
jgi:hypothetical protein